MTNDLEVIRDTSNQGKCEFSLTLGGVCIAVAETDYVNKNTMLLTHINVDTEFRCKKYGTTILRNVVADSEKRKAIVLVSINQFSGINYSVVNHMLVKAGFSAYSFNGYDCLARVPKSRARLVGGV